MHSIQEQLTHIWNCFRAGKSIISRRPIYKTLVKNSITLNFQKTENLNENLYVLIIIKSQNQQTSRKIKMQVNNIFYFPYYLFNNMGPYSAIFSCFQPLIDCNSSYQQCQLSGAHPVKIFSASSESPQISDIDRDPLAIVGCNTKRTKHSAENLKVKQEKIQLFCDKNSKIQKFQGNEQNEGRNAKSNFLRMFFRQLQKKIKYTPYKIQQVITKYQMKITLEQFIAWIQTNKVDHQNYIKLASIKKFFVDQRFVRQQTKIMRILLKNFIDSESISCYLTSKKVRRQAMAHNYNALRNIFNQIFGINCLKVE